MTNVVPDIDINVRSAKYFIACTAQTCPQCHASTRRVALALPPGHETLELSDVAGGARAPGVDAKGAHEPAADRTQQGDVAIGETPSDIWSTAGHGAFLFYIEYLPAVIAQQVRDFSIGYRLKSENVDPDVAMQSYWANHCERCGAEADEDELFCEPDGAFLPTSETRAGVIHLLAIDAPFEAVAGGYAYEPAFFDAMTRE